MKSCVFLVLVLGFAALANAQTYWQLINTYSDSSCTTRTGATISDVGGICNPVTCTQSGDQYYKVDCLDQSNGPPQTDPTPTGWAVLLTWYTPDGTCPFPSSAGAVASPGTCQIASTDGNTRFKLTTDCATSFTYETFNTADCSGTAVYSITPSGVNTCESITQDTTTFDASAYCVMAPVAPPVDAPVAAPLDAPVAAPMTAPVAAPVAAPVKAPTSTPVKKNDAVSVGVSAVALAVTGAVLII